MNAEELERQLVEYFKLVHDHLNHKELIERERKILELVRLKNP